MSEKTHAEIIDEIRLKCARAYWSEDSLHPNGDIPEIKCLEPHKLATQLESAHNREVDALNEQIADLRQQRNLWSKRAAELVEKCNEQYAKLKQVDDAAKLREAMCEILSYIESFHKYIIPGKREKTTALFAVADTIRSKARAALTAPTRNCEVGTAEEQSKRLHDYCKSHRCLNCSSGNGDECKFYRPGMKTDCKIEWANAPYEEGGAK